MGNNTKYTAQRELAFLLVDAGRKLNDACDVHMKPLGLTRSQWRVLAYVSRTPGITQTQLAANVELSRMAITGLLDRMQAKGLLERRSVAVDRRVKTVHLTRKAEALISRMNQTAAEVLNSIFADISAPDKTRLHDMLDTVKGNAANVERSVPML